MYFQFLPSQVKGLFAFSTLLSKTMTDLTVTQILCHLRHLNLGHIYRLPLQVTHTHTKKRTLIHDTQHLKDL